MAACMCVWARERLFWALAVLLMYNWWCIFCDFLFEISASKQHQYERNTEKKNLIRMFAMPQWILFGLSWFLLKHFPRQIHSIKTATKKCFGISTYFLIYFIFKSYGNSTRVLYIIFCAPSRRVFEDFAVADSYFVCVTNTSLI